MNYNLIRYFAIAKLSVECRDYFGFKPSLYDVTGKLSHMFRVNNPSTINTKELRDHILKTISEYCSRNRGRVIAHVVGVEIDKIRKNPSKPLPLP